MPQFVKTLVCLIAAMTVSNISYAQTYQSTLRDAEQGNADAQFNLGVMYDTGEGVPENDVEAVNWYRKATEQGYARAQFNLGVMYADGEGVPENDVEAVKWLSLIHI